MDFQHFLTAATDFLLNRTKFLLNQTKFSLNQIKLPLNQIKFLLNQKHFSNDVRNFFLTKYRDLEPGDEEIELSTVFERRWTQAGPTKSQVSSSRLSPANLRLET